MDPTLDVTIRGESRQSTAPHLSGGKKPDWKGEELIFQLSNAD
jgi:hypothetical protein